MDKPAFQQLVKRPPVESLRATGGCTLEIHRQVLKGRLRGQRADASTGHAEAFAADSCSDLLVFLLDMNNAPFVIDSIFISDTAGTDSFEDESGNIISGRKYINSSQMKIYDAVNDQEAGYEHLISGRTYYIYADIGEIFKTDQSIQLHVQMHTEIGRGSSLQSTPTVSDCVTIGRAEIFDLD